MNILRTKLTVHSPVSCILIGTRCLSTQTPNHARLAEVGTFASPNENEDYKAGQFFLHKIFGYRGVVLFPWYADLYERLPKDTTDRLDDAVIKEPTNSIDQKPLTKKKPTLSSIITNLTESDKSFVNQQIVKKNINPSHVSVTKAKFYQVLADSRDCPYVRAQTEAVTFLGKKNSNKSIYSVPGLDYVSHEDILPYSVSPNERQPLRHELFDKFLAVIPGTKRFESTETLHLWHLKNHPWLELSEVHRETTENIRVTVIPFYMGSRNDANKKVYWWRYSIRLENLGDVEVKLRERNWRIFSLSGTLETVRGRGVVGQEPALNSRLPAFQYSSHVSLQAASGHMWGTFLMERENGTTFDVRIPPFCLESEHNEEESDEDDMF